MLRRVTMLVFALAIAVSALSLAQPQQVLAGSFNAPVLLIHGFNVNSERNCNAAPNSTDDWYWGDVKQYFGWQKYTNVKTLGFYKGDYNCDDYIQQESQFHCTGWYDSGSNDGTVNEDIRHTSCLLAWYIWDHYTIHNVRIAVIAHSMGGILIRQAMNDTPYVGAFPPDLMISDVVTAGTPHEGVIQGSAWAFTYGASCPGNCIEVYQMQNNNPLMTNLNSASFRGGFGRNPQGSGGTDWTTMASNNDDVLRNGCDTNLDVPPTNLGAPWAANYASLCGMMLGATHFVIYQGPSPSYDLGGYLSDESSTWNADECYSDNNGGTWYQVSDSEHSIYTMYQGILSSGW